MRRHLRTALALLLIPSAAGLQPAAPGCPMAGRARAEAPSEEAASGHHAHHGSRPAAAPLPGAAAGHADDASPGHSDSGCGLIMACGSVLLAARGGSGAGAGTPNVEAAIRTAAGRYSTVVPTQEPPPPRLPV